MRGEARNSVRGRARVRRGHVTVKGVGEVRRMGRACVDKENIRMGSIFGGRKGGWAGERADRG
jgi:hypothetical protein